MLVAGTICVGLVWGWLLVRRIHRSRWQAIAQMLLGLAAQMALIAALLRPLSLLWFGGGVVIGAFLAAMALRSWVVPTEVRAP